MTVDGEIQLFETQQKLGIMTLGWFHTHPEFVSLDVQFNAVLGTFLIKCWPPQLAWLPNVASRVNSSRLQPNRLNARLQSIPDKIIRNLSNRELPTDWFPQAHNQEWPGNLWRMPTHTVHRCQPARCPAKRGRLKKVMIIKSHIIQTFECFVCLSGCSVRYSCRLPYTNPHLFRRLLRWAAAISQWHRCRPRHAARGSGFFTGFRCLTGPHCSAYSKVSSREARCLGRRDGLSAKHRQLSQSNVTTSNCLQMSTRCLSSRYWSYF